MVFSPSRTHSTGTVSYRHPTNGLISCDVGASSLLRPACLNLNCDSVYSLGFSHIRVLPPDPRRFDGGDNDGMGCENPPSGTDASGRNRLSSGMGA